MTLPGTADVRDILGAAGLHVVTWKIVAQTIAPDSATYADELAAGGDSVLARLSRQDFDAGLAALRRHGMTAGLTACRRADRFVRSFTYVSNGERDDDACRLLQGRRGPPGTWIATAPHRRSFPGSTMARGRDLPHDLLQFTIERALEIRDGFWGLLAHGGWFASVPGRRPSPQGRAVVRAHHAALVAVEGVVNAHYLAWKRGSLLHSNRSSM